MNPPKEVIDYRMIFASSCLDFVANFALTIGFFYIGSGVKLMVNLVYKIEIESKLKYPFNRTAK